MKTIRPLFIILGLLAHFVFLQAQEASIPNYILLKNAHIIDCISDDAKKGDLLIKDSQIESIDFDESITLPKGAVIYDLTDQYIIPGLIDAHVHFGTDPSGADNFEDTQKRLRYLLKNGITSVRDMAGDTRYLSFIARSASLDEIESPDIYYSALMAGSTFFDDPRTHSSTKGAQPGNCAWMRAVDEKTDMTLAIAEGKGTGASAIKIYADLDAGVIQKIAKAAHQQNIKTWAHAAVFPAKPMEIVNAGVDVLSHATLLAWEGVDYLPSSAKGRYVKQNNFDIAHPSFIELFKTMKEKGTMLDATLAVYEKYDSSIFRQGITLTHLAYREGIEIGVGTDMDLKVSDLPEIEPIFREMELLVKEVGMSRMEVLKAATLVNAKMIGIENQVGSIEVGKDADLVILMANPLDDILNAGAIRFVVKHGRVIRVD